MKVFVFFLSVLFLISCARQGTPTGGPKDTNPPKYLGSSPDTLSLNVSTDLKEIRINFDEYLLLKDANKNIVVSPPFKGNASFLPMGSPNKSVIVKLDSPLEPNTTYNINFGNAIQDNNEGNKLAYFQYVFSTGDFIDSLEITGTAKVPGQKKQPENIVVALYKMDSAYQDSLVIREKPFYVSKLDENGKFKLNYLHQGKYQMIAFEDKVENMQFDLGKEKFGFIAEPILLDSIQEINIQLFDQQPGYKFGKAEQKGYGQLLFRLNGQAESVEVIPFESEFTTAKIDYKAKSDSLNFWFNPGVDSISEKSKRFKFLVKHENQTDTVSLVYSNSTQHRLLLDSKSKLDLAPSRKVEFNSNYPLNAFDESKISVKKDSIDLNFKLTQDPKNEHKFVLDFPVELNAQYKIEFLPNAVTDFFGKTNDSISLNLKTKTRNDYGNLNLKLQTELDKPFWIQLLNEKDEVLDEQYTTNKEFHFNYLAAGNYYFKIMVDENENQFWDTGNFFTKKQPEAVYVYPDLINVRVLWDIDETWVIQ